MKIGCYYGGGKPDEYIILDDDGEFVDVSLDELLEKLKEADYDIDRLKVIDKDR